MPRARAALRTAIVLVTLAASAALLARGATRLLADRLLSPTAPSAHAQSVAAAPGDSPQALADAILARNIFESTPESLPPVAPPPPRFVGPSDELPACAGDTRLVAALVVPRRPEQSLASIASDGRTALLAPGMRVGEREVVGIREQRVFLRGSDATTCQLGMFTPAQGMEAAQAEAPPGAGDPRITRQGENSYVVTRALFAEAVNPGALATTARVTKTRAGLRLSGVRPGSLLEQLGMRNGDVLHTLNGVDLSDADAALGAYPALREADQFDLRVVRRGRELQLRYAVR